MPFITIAETPLIPDQQQLPLYYEVYGQGRPLIWLHGGWGYQIYPIDSQLAYFTEFQTIIPTRSGYGKSPKITHLTDSFHQQAAYETLHVLDALGIEKAIFWGHSDGAVIAAKIGLIAPNRVQGLVLEAFHYTCAKHNSQEFFREMAENPTSFGTEVSQILAQEHGEDNWQQVLKIEGAVWLRIIANSNNQSDLFQGQLSQLQCPVMLLHGSRDPRTEADELAQVQDALPHAHLHLIEGSGHSPHSSAKSQDQCNLLVANFFQEIS